jgi:hypothetical protein
MHLTLQNYLVGATSSLLEMLVFAFALRRKLHLRLPVFTAYVALMVAREVSLWWVYLGPGYGSSFAFHYFWVTQVILLVARGAAIAEIAWRALCEYRGVWSLAWRILVAVGLVLVLYAASNARANSSWITPFVLSLERGLELAVVVILVSLLAICRYYRVGLESLERKIALGLALYSAVQVANNSILGAWLAHYFDWWNAIRSISFQAALVIWWLALRKPVPAVAPAPALLPQKVYDELSPKVNYRLRVLNQRLLELLKS